MKNPLTFVVAAVIILDWDGSILAIMNTAVRPVSIRGAPLFPGPDTRPELHQVKLAFGAPGRLRVPLTLGRRRSSSSQAKRDMQRKAAGTGRSGQWSGCGVPGVGFMPG
jgi:hypothetical protein